MLGTAAGGLLEFFSAFDHLVEGRSALLQVSHDNPCLCRLSNTASLRPKPALDEPDGDVSVVKEVMALSSLRRPF